MIRTTTRVLYESLPYRPVLCTQYMADTTRFMQLNNAGWTIVILFSIFSDNLHLILIMFSDPTIHQKLHETHVQKYSSYYGYWYKQDLYAFNPQVIFILIFLHGNCTCTRDETSDYVFWLISLIESLRQINFLKINF